MGNNYSILLSMFTAGNLVGQIPHALIIQKIQPRIGRGAIGIGAHTTRHPRTLAVTEARMELRSVDTARMTLRDLAATVTEQPALALRT